MTDRSHWPVRKSTLAEQGYEDDLTHLSMGERMAIVWQVTVQAWALAGETVTDKEFQRHVIRVERRGS
jgi:hypothetical protein